MKTIMALLLIVVFLVLGFMMTYFYQKSQIEQHEADAQQMIEQVSRITTSLTDIDIEPDSSQQNNQSQHLEESY
jgi:uncharacterized protein involved in exopolysaccharide biosynthesis